MSVKNLKYKGYRGSVEFNEIDNRLYGKVFGVKKPVIYEGNTIEELKDNFHKAIDSYINICVDCGVNPERDFSGSFNVRIDQAEHRLAAENAANSGISLNQYVKDAIYFYNHNHSVNQHLNYGELVQKSLENQNQFRLCENSEKNKQDEALELAIELLKAAAALNK